MNKILKYITVFIQMIRLSHQNTIDIYKLIELISILKGTHIIMNTELDEYRKSIIETRKRVIEDK
jgi:hypothetical protein